MVLCISVFYNQPPTSRAARGAWQCSTEPAWLFFSEKGQNSATLLSLQILQTQSSAKSPSEAAHSGAMQTKPSHSSATALGTLTLLPIAAALLAVLAWGLAVGSSLGGVTRWGRLLRVAALLPIAGLLAVGVLLPVGALLGISALIVTARLCGGIAGRQKHFKDGKVSQRTQTCASGCSSGSHKKAMQL